jgi:hypothetical protein
MSVVFGRTTQNSFPFGSASTVHDSCLSARCPLARAERKKALNLGVPVVTAGRQVQVHAVLHGLHIRHGHEKHADRSMNRGLRRLDF